jgi:hypothetical protein
MSLSRHGFVSSEVIDRCVVVDQSNIGRHRRFGHLYNVAPARAVKCTIWTTVGATRDRRAQ